jgi:hypothetical protein
MTQFRTDKSFGKFPTGLSDKDMNVLKFLAMSQKCYLNELPMTDATGQYIPWVQRQKIRAGAEMSLDFYCTRVRSNGNKDGQTEHITCNALSYCVLYATKEDVPHNTDVVKIEGCQPIKKPTEVRATVFGPDEAFTDVFLQQLVAKFPKNTDGKVLEDFKYDEESAAAAHAAAQATKAGEKETKMLVCSYSSSGTLMLGAPPPSSAGKATVAQLPAHAQSAIKEAPLSSSSSSISSVGMGKKADDNHTDDDGGNDSELPLGQSTQSEV